MVVQAVYVQLWPTNHIPRPSGAGKKHSSPLSAGSGASKRSGSSNVLLSQTTTSTSNVYSGMRTRGLGPEKMALVSEEQNRAYWRIERKRQKELTLTVTTVARAPAHRAGASLP